MVQMLDKSEKCKKNYTVSQKNNTDVATTRFDNF